MEERLANCYVAKKLAKESATLAMKQRPRFSDGLFYGTVRFAHIHTILLVNYKERRAL